MASKAKSPAGSKPKPAEETPSAAAVETPPEAPTETETPEAPKAEVAQVAAVAKRAPVVVEQVDQRMVRIRPRVDVPRCSIGGKWYSFAKGHETSVPEDVRRHLEERGIL